MGRSPREIDGTQLDTQSFNREAVNSCKPTILRGLVRHWPVVIAGRQSPRALRDYLLQFDTGKTLEAFFGDPCIAGKYYYSGDLKSFNFERRAMRFSAALDAILDGLDQPGSQSIYIGSFPVDPNLPGFTAQNVMTLLPPVAAPRIWLGHASNVSCHYDAFENLACVVAGRRRFTLYAPELISKLYVGPIDHTMAGQPVSMAASSPGAGDKFPRFMDVKDQALIAELEPGDALYLPKLWWHQVEGTAPFNGLVNYWWDAFSIGPDAPYTSLLLAMITICERPPEERQAWRAFFDHYVFRPEGHPLAHLPPERHGLLGPLKPSNYGAIRARVMHLLRGV